MTRRIHPLLLAAAASATAACAEPTGTDPVAGAANLAFEPFVYETETGRRVQSELGVLWVPATGTNRSTVALRFVRLPSVAEDSASPIVYLAGGPGGSGIATGRGERFDYFNNLRRRGDVILLDQRGTGWSSPATGCEGSYDIDPTIIDPDEQAAIMIRQVGSCGAALAGRSIDMNAFNTARSADDLEALRVALQVEQLVLVGYSYGTHLALSYIRRYPGRVAGAVLHGVEGPDHTLKLPLNAERSLAEIDRLVRADPRAGALLPDLLGTLDSMLTALEMSPETTSVDSIQVVVGKLDAQRLIWGGIGDRGDIEELPAAVLALRQFGWAVAGPAVLQLRTSPLGLGMSYTMDCASGASAARQAQIELEASGTLLGNAITFPFPRICDGWSVTDLGDQFRSPIVSDAPVLFVSGSLDSRTPESNAIEVAQGFANGRMLLVENAGHNDLATSPLIHDIVLRFLAGDESVPNRVSLPNLRFETELVGGSGEQ